MAAQYQPQEGHNPAYQPQPAHDVPPQVDQAYPEPIKPQDQQYAGHMPPPGQPAGGYYVQPQTPPPDNTHLLIAWILFAVGFIVPLTWVIGLFMPCCRRPRWTKGTFIAWLLSLIALIAYIVLITLLIVLVGNNDDDAVTCEGYYRRGVFRCFR